LVPARPEPVFAVERFYDVLGDIKPLQNEQWNELGRDKARVRLDPDWSSFAGLDTSGLLKILTARVDGVLVGYVANLVSFHLHYKSTLHATVNAYWLAPAYRKGWTGIKMLRRNEDELRRMGVVRLFVDDSVAFKNARDRRTRKLFAFLGYTPTGVVYRKIL
jgi:GNAT superfamily N-acetyltransferase